MVKKVVSFLIILILFFCAMQNIVIATESVQEDSSYHINYKAHVQYDGWHNLKADGSIAGTIGEGKRLEAIQIKIVPKVKKGTISLKSPSNGQTFYNPSTIKVSGSKSANLSSSNIKVYLDSIQTIVVLF